MNTASPSIRTWLFGILAALLFAAAGVLLWGLSATSDFGESDFKIYWSAAYLLGRGENPYSLDAIRTVQETRLHSTPDADIIAWNPPFLFVVLLPLSWLPFPLAKFAWLVTNILMILSAGLLLAGVYLEAARPALRLAFLVLVMAFPAAITGLYMGQVTFLVFWGLVASLALLRRGQWFWGGAALVLTTIKPHMVVLAILYLLLSAGVRRKFQVWLGLAAAGLAFLGVLLLFRADVLLSLLGETSVAAGLWATSTLGGLLSYLGVTEAARYLVLLLLPLPVFLAWHPERFSPEFSVALLTLLTVPTTIFGWSYDQTILLIPIAQIFAWLPRSRYAPALLALIALVLALSYYQRTLPLNEVFYVWIPLAWGAVFGLAWRGRPAAVSRHA